MSIIDRLTLLKIRVLAALSPQRGSSNPLRRLENELHKLSHSIRHLYTLLIPLSRPNSTRRSYLVHQKALTTDLTRSPSGMQQRVPSQPTSLGVVPGRGD